MCVIFFHLTDGVWSINQVESVFAHASQNKFIIYCLQAKYSIGVTYMCCYGSHCLEFRWLHQELMASIGMFVHASDYICHEGLGLLQKCFGSL